MSEPAPEAAAPKPAGKKENVFTRKLGPLPMWAWVAIASAVLIGYFYLKNKNSASTSTGTGTNASTIPQFVNQVYTSVVPPTAPPPPTDKDTDSDKDKDKDKTGVPWKDESKKDRRIRNWEHHHKGLEYPFNTWQGNPTAAELEAFKDNPKVQPPMTQASVVPSQVTGPLVGTEGSMPTTSGGGFQELGGSFGGKRLA